MDYSFNKEIACKYGVDAAVLIHNLYWWLGKNYANGKHIYRGRVWTYNTQAAFLQLFPFWTAKQLRRILNGLKEDGAIIVDYFNKTPLDRTQWFSLSDGILAIYARNGGIDLRLQDVAVAAGEDPRSDSVGEKDDVSTKEEMITKDNEGGQKTAKTGETLRFAQMGKCNCPNGQLQVPERADVPDSKPNIIPDISQSISPSSNCKTYNISPLPPQDGLTDGLRESPPIDPITEYPSRQVRPRPESSAKARWYLDCIRERLSGSVLGEEEYRFSTVCEDIARQKEIRVNDCPIASDEILRNLLELLRDPERIREAYAIINERISCGKVTNKFGYIVSTLYNAARI